MELVMGHLLVPLQGGLFEARPFGQGRNPVTGVRESALMILRGTQGFLSQAEYDDPAHDAQFPDHPVSQVRHALRSLMTAWDLCVTRPAPLPATREIFLSQLGC